MNKNKNGLFSKNSVTVWIYIFCKRTNYFNWHVLILSIYRYEYYFFKSFCCSKFEKKCGFQNTFSQLGIFGSNSVSGTSRCQCFVHVLMNKIFVERNTVFMFRIHE